MGKKGKIKIIFLKNFSKNSPTIFSQFQQVFYPQSLSFIPQQKNWKFCLNPRQFSFPWSGVPPKNGKISGQISFHTVWNSTERDNFLGGITPPHGQKRQKQFFLKNVLQESSLNSNNYSTHNHYRLLLNQKSKFFSRSKTVFIFTKWCFSAKRDHFYVA